MTGHHPRLDRRFPRPRELAPFLTLRSRAASASERRLRTAHTIDDLRAIALRRTPAGPFHYVDGGAENEISLSRTREAFADVQFNPSVLRDVHECDPSTVVLGMPSALPFGFAPTGGTRMMHAAGERAVARAAARAGIPYMLSTAGTTSLSDLADHVPGGRLWFQLYLLTDRDRSLEMIADARRLGYDTLILTADTPVTGLRLRDLRTGMSYPPQLTVRTFLDAAPRVEWWFNLLTTAPYRFNFERDDAGAPSGTGSGVTSGSTTFEDLAWLREAWTGNLVLKGVQTLADAQRAADHGVDGIILSNHGGRQLDRTRPPLHLLPEVVRDVGSSVEVMIDSGFRSGSDVVAAIALGAKCVFLGRAYLYGLMAGGEAGVDRAVEILRSETLRTMALLGTARIEDLHPEHVTLLSRLHDVERSA